MYDIEEKPEEAIAISVIRKGMDRDEAIDHLDELEFLAETAGAEVKLKIVQEMEKPNPSTAIGKGKLREIQAEIEENNLSLVIFDDDLNPVQTRNLENFLEVKVIDRSGLILDIFAKRAKTTEAKTQVELAQLQYLLPRLTRMWTHLSKQYGGIGTKGPGETQIETDRRIIRRRIQKLKEKIDEIETYREQQRKGRELMPRYALVGYTNAGKSTLMNAISNAGVYIEDQLFATLDTTVRSFELPGGHKALISDTVGFIRKLPANLVASFRSTLAEAREADIILHVVDVSHSQFRDHILVVEETLEELKITGRPVILIFNKVDMLEDLHEIGFIEEEFPGSILISAQRGINLPALLEAMQKIYDEQSKIESIVLPYSMMAKVSEIYDNAEILSRKDTEDGIEFDLRIPAEKYDYFCHVFKDILEV